MNRLSVRFSSGRSLAATFAFAMIAVTPAMASPITFGAYVQSNVAQQQWTISTAGTTTTVMASGQVYISFSAAAGMPFGTAPELANFTLNATSTQLGNCGVNCGAGDSFVQPGYSGTFSFLDAGSVPGMNLLSGTFAVTGSPATTGAQFSSAMGSSGGSFNASATAGNLNQLVFTSAYMNFTGDIFENASWSLSSLTPNFAVTSVVGAQARPLGSFDTAGSGTFSAATPEPATFSLIGGALIGLGILRRRRMPRT